MARLDLEMMESAVADTLDEYTRATTFTRRRWNTTTGRVAHPRSVLTAASPPHAACAISASLASQAGRTDSFLRLVPQPCKTLRA